MNERIEADLCFTPLGVTHLRASTCYCPHTKRTEVTDSYSSSTVMCVYVASESQSKAAATQRYARHARYVRYVCYTNKKSSPFY
jgi:hypothetical protein